MEQEITEEYLQSLEGLCEKIIPGPWETATVDDHPEATKWAVRGPSCSEEFPNLRWVVCKGHYVESLSEDDLGYSEVTRRTNEFIAASREALPLLLSEVRNLREFRRIMAGSVIYHDREKGYMMIETTVNKGELVYSELEGMVE